MMKFIQKILQDGLWNFKLHDLQLMKRGMFFFSFYAEKPHGFSLRKKITVFTYCICMCIHICTYIHIYIHMYMCFYTHKLNNISF